MSVTTSTKSFRDMTRREAIALCYILEEQRDKALSKRDALAARVADAWDEGWLASKRHERSEGQPKMSYWPNPYRTALTEGKRS